MFLEESKGYLKAKLEAFAKEVENERQALEQVPTKASNELKRSTERKEQAETVLKQGFSAIREALSVKEAQVMKAIDGEGTANDERLSGLVSDTQDLLDKLSSALEAEKALLSEWDTSGTSPEVVFKATQAMEISKDVAKVKGAVKDLLGYETVLDTTNFTKEVGTIVQLINSIKGAETQKTLRTPSNFVAKTVGPFSVSLEWDMNESSDVYTVAFQKQDGKQSPNKTQEYSENTAVVAPLVPDSTYKFCVNARRDRTFSKWSEVLEVKTPLPNNVEALVGALIEHSENPEVCTKILEILCGLTKGNGKNN